MVRLFIFASFLLVAALLFHAAHLEHHHPLEFGNGIQALLHGEDRKWLIALLLAALFAVAVSLPRRFFSVEFPGHTVSLGVDPELSFSILMPLRSAIRTGIVHPKLYA